MATVLRSNNSVEIEGNDSKEMRTAEKGRRWEEKGREKEGKYNAFAWGNEVVLIRLNVVSLHYEKKHLPGR